MVLNQTKMENGAVQKTRGKDHWFATDKLPHNGKNLF
jgi:hypothetical protein